jgi:plasmid maintenance system antidote protein VapI
MQAIFKEHLMGQIRNRSARKGRIERDSDPKMSYAQAFDAPAVKQHLESIRVSLPVSQKSAAEIEEITRSGQSTRFTGEIGADLGAISVAYEDFLLIHANEFPQAGHEPPHPLFALSEFLDTLGFIDYSGVVDVDGLARQAGVPSKKLIRVLRGHAPITPAMSKALSEVFETSPEYLIDLQRAMTQPPTRERNE